jgi:hypothetical protein
VSTNLERPPHGAEAIALPAPGGLSPSPRAAGLSAPRQDTTPDAAPAAATLASLPVGARLILRCRKDWRVASVSSVGPEGVRLCVASPSGHTYRVRRPAASPLTFDGALPLLGELPPPGWRAALARYDARW